MGFLSFRELSSLKIEIASAFVQCLPQTRKNPQANSSMSFLLSRDPPWSFACFPEHFKKED